MLKVRSHAAALTTPLLEADAAAHSDALNSDGFSAAASRTAGATRGSGLPDVDEVRDAAEAAHETVRSIERLSPRRRLMWLAHSARDLQQVPAQLAETARRAGVRFVCLDHPDRLDSLLVSLAPHQDGWRVGDGPLQRLFCEGGWLYVHYEHFSAAEAESLNELFAHQPTFRGQILHPNVTVFGAMLRSTLAHESASEAFVSRFDAWVDASAMPGAQSDAAVKVERITPDALIGRKAAVISMFGDHDHASRLCARACLENGRAKVQPGALRAALAQNDCVVLRDAPLDDISFCLFLQDLHKGAASDLEGPLHLKSGQRVLFCDGVSEAEQTAALGRFLRTPPAGLEAHAVTARNFGFLSRTIAIDAGQVREAPGVLEQLAPQMPLRVVAKLLPHQWRELAFGHCKRTVYVDDRVALPTWLSGHFVARSGSVPPAVPCRLQGLTDLPQGQSCVVHCEDLELATDLLLDAVGNAEAFDVGETHESGDFLYAMRRHEHRFAWRARDMWTALQNGKTVILRRLSSNSNVACDLLPLLTSRTPTLWCERTPAPMRGRLIVLEPLQTSLPAARHFKLDMAKLDLAHNLQAQYPWVDVKWVEAVAETLEELGTLRHRRKLIAGETPSLQALARRVAALQQGGDLLPLADKTSQAQALAMVFGGVLEFDAAGRAALRDWIARTFSGATPICTELRQPRTRAMWDQKLDACADLLRRWPAIMLQGPSGAGKTYCTQAVAKRLEATVHGPLSVGDDTRIDDILGEVRVHQGSTVWHPATIDAWARARGPGLQVLVIDEANLAPAEFWNFLAGMFDKKPGLVIDGQRVALGPLHRLILTGNQDSYPGRNVAHFIKSHCITVPFHSFDDGFLVDEILAPVLSRLLATVSPTVLQEVKQTCRAMLTMLREAHAEQLFTPRNMEEAVLRAVLRPGGVEQEQLPANLAHALLDVQPGATTPEQDAALRARVTLQWGAAPPLAPPAWLEAASLSDRGLVLTESSAELAARIADFLAVRSQRRGGAYAGLGQSAMLIEGPSGRGKDEWAMSLCEAAGLPRLATDGSARGDGYMCLNAGLGFSHLRDMIDQAQRRGQLVLISELNLLGSALVEGQLNALLQGQAAPGFAVIATVNPGFTGRRSMSDAQRNRCICVSLAPYRETELLQIATARLGGHAADLAPRVVTYHQSIIAMLSAAELTTRPTPRELLRACDALPDSDVAGVLRRVYKPYLLMANVPDVGPGMLPAETRVHLTSLAQWMSEQLGQRQAPVVHPDNRAEAPGVMHFAHRSIHVAGRSTLREQAAQVMIHAAAAACHAPDATSQHGLTGAAWQAFNAALGYRITERLLLDNETTRTAVFAALPALPDALGAWKRAAEAKTRQAHFAYGLACELVAPGTHAKAPLDRLTAEQRESCAEVIFVANRLVAGLDAVAAMGTSDARQALQAVRAHMRPIMERYVELAPLTAWQTICSVLPLEAMGAALDFVADGVGAVADAVQHGAVVTGRFVIRHKKPILIITSPVWVPPAVALGLAGGAAVAAGLVAFGVAGGALMGVEWGVDAVGGALFNWRLNRNLPSPNKPFRYHGSLDKLRDVDFVQRPRNVTATGEGYLAEGYSSDFTTNGNLKPGRYPDVMPPAPEPDAQRVMEVAIGLDAAMDLQKKGGAYRISLPVVGQTCPVNVQIQRMTGETLPGTVTVARTDDGRFMGVLSHSRYQLFGPRSFLAHAAAGRVSRSVTRQDQDSGMGNPLQLRYDLHPQAKDPAPEVYGQARVPFQIDYAAWPEFAAFCDTLTPAAPKAGVQALCDWLNENALYDRGRRLAAAYGWSETSLSFNDNPVNVFMRARRGCSLQTAQVFMAVVRDKLRVPVRVATGVYLGEPRTPRPVVQTMHAWCEVHLPGQGWVTFDPTARRWSDHWVRRRSNFYDALSAQVRMYIPPPHVPVLEKSGDTFEKRTTLREAAPTDRLRVTYEVAGDEVLSEEFAEFLGREFSEQLFISGLRPQQRLAFAPPGTLDIARLARGEAKAFVNTDVGRTPLRKTVLVAANDMVPQGAPSELTPMRAARIYWSAIFQLGCPVEVLRAQGDLVKVADIDEMLALMDNDAQTRNRREIEKHLRRYDAMIGQAAKQIRSSNQYARLDRSAMDEAFIDLIHNRIASPVTVARAEATITDFDMAQRSGWAALTHVTFHNIILTHRIYDALKYMPQLRSITVTGGLTLGRMRVPFLPHLRSVKYWSMDPLDRWTNFDFVPGSTPWPIQVAGWVHHVNSDTPDAAPVRAFNVHAAGLGRVVAGDHIPASQLVRYDRAAPPAPSEAAQFDLDAAEYRTQLRAYREPQTTAAAPQPPADH